MTFQVRNMHVGLLVTVSFDFYVKLSPVSRHVRAHSRETVKYSDRILSFQTHVIMLPNIVDYDSLSFHCHKQMQSGPESRAQFTLMFK